MPLFDTLFGGFPKVVLQHMKTTDFVDRLNYLHTVMILMGCAIVVTLKQYVFEPIQCWVPPQFTKSWEEYVENYCWVQNTYFLPVHMDIPNLLERRKEKELSYYQWVPFILGFQALLFYLPFCLWIIFSNLSGFNVEIVVKMASECLDSDVRVRDKTRKSLARYLSCHLGILKMDQTRKKVSIFQRKLRPLYLTSVYLTSKLLYIVNSICQFYLLNWMLDTKDTLFGLRVLSNLIHGIEWEQSSIFPRVTLCDFLIRDIGDNRPYTVQCVLATNMLNEKIFLFFWFWLVFMSIVNILCFCWWLYKLGLRSQRVSFVTSLVSPEFGGTFENYQTECRIVKTLVSQYLFPDGVFLIRLIMTNFGIVICSDLVALIATEFLQPKSPSQNGKIPNENSSKEADQLFFEEDRVGTNPTTPRQRNIGFLEISPSSVPSHSSSVTIKPENKESTNRPTQTVRRDNDGFHEWIKGALEDYQNQSHV